MVTDFIHSPRYNLDPFRIKDENNTRFLLVLRAVLYLDNSVCLSEQNAELIDIFFQTQMKYYATWCFCIFIYRK